MGRIASLFILLLTLIGCSEIKIRQYNSIVDHADRIEIQFKNSDQKVVLDSDQIESFKSILKRNIEPELSAKFTADIRIDLYDGEDRIGFFLVSENATKPFVNFDSDDLNFSFRLTYGIGRYLAEIR